MDADKNVHRDFVLFRCCFIYLSEHRPTRGSHLQDVSKGVEALAARRVCVQAVSGYTGPLSWWAW